MKVIKKIFGYLSFRKEEENTDNVNIKMMHGINKISLLIFVVALVVLMIRYMTS